MKRTLHAVATAALLVGAMPAMAQDSTLETPESKVSYALGMMIGERVIKQYGEVDYDLLVKAMKAQAAGDATDLSMEEAQMVLQEQQQAAAAEAAAAAQEAGMSYLEENKAREGVMVTDSGLQYEVLSEGEGPKPTADDTVSVHYVGTLMDGTEFDSSIARGEPASFPLKGVIPGWTEGLQLMNVGSKYRFVIPSDLAYGERGAGQAIGPGETLIFEVELLEIKS
ncbi:FKBP-type peptidyl-prolyl cis-trans isomerase [Granulosicoccus sp. 3-233]|uniref:FKBP-type peptidyl-prolyl cis-trans isomerase n=1 Tax=Granulosicoccus sp. 3-233 TaxID=3417969 RepID=UPI003D32D883